ncbi:class D sortase [Virgibacillus byunsanensis]|uniref:Class D sortase n=1 Tax=Virgibacillus byunsanensis TaxID=570945 RepID=A0ABW3LPI7_9BACI
MKKVSALLLLAGLTFLFIGGYQWLKLESSQKNSLAEARDLLDKEGKSVTNSDETSSNSETNRATTFSPSTGETAGILHIPKLNEDLPIVEGTDENELAKGVGHYQGTAYPLQNDQIVLSGHRDTVFRRMGELELGDILTVQLPYGDFSYEIVETKIVDADDRSVIVPTAPDEVLTLTTCYPFTFVGDAPDRYIISALPVSEVD